MGAMVERFVTPINQMPTRPVKANLDAPPMIRRRPRAWLPATRWRLTLVQMLNFVCAG